MRRANYWRLPTIQECGRLINISTWSGVDSQKGTTPGDFTTYSRNSSTNIVTFTSPGSMTLYPWSGDWLSYWSSTSNGSVGWDLYFSSTSPSGHLGNGSTKTTTFPVRCVYSK